MGSKLSRFLAELKRRKVTRVAVAYAIVGLGVIEAASMIFPALFIPDWAYRLVVAATGEYTTFHGGTAVAGQAAIVTTINRVNQVYERDLSIRMILVGNNINVVYTNGATDPYTNGDHS